MNPIISILLPIYNGEKHLKETVKSLLSQSFQDFEILACIDGSNDSSEMILKEFKDTRIRIFQNDANLGLGRTLNKLVYHANPNSEFLAMAEQDDIYYPNRLEKQLRVFKSFPEIGLVSGIADFFDGEKVTGKFPGMLVEGKRYPRGKEMFILNYVNQIKVVNSCMMVRKTVHISNGFYFTMHLPSISVDWTYILRFSLVSDIYGIPESLVKLRRSKNHGSLTSNKKRVFESSRELIRSMKYEFSEIIDSKLFKQSNTTQDIFELKSIAKSKIPLKFIRHFFINPRDKRWVELFKYFIKRK